MDYCGANLRTCQERVPDMPLRLLVLAQRAHIRSQNIHAWHGCTRIAFETGTRLEVRTHPRTHNPAAVRHALSPALRASVLTLPLQQ